MVIGYNDVRMAVRDRVRSPLAVDMVGASHQPAFMLLVMHLCGLDAQLYANAWMMMITIIIYN